jgi:hypothetical protein
VFIQGFIATDQSRYYANHTQITHYNALSISDICGCGEKQSMSFKVLINRQTNCLRAK